MRLLLNIIIVVLGICGIAISFVSDMVVSSPLAYMDGMELSSWMIVFFIIMFISGAYNLIDNH